jgi:hypothetical protein
VKEHTLDTNVTCYIANGVWHHYLATGDTGFLDEFWPSSSARSTSRSTTSTDRRDRVARRHALDDGALLTGSSSIYAQLRCAIAIAERLGHERPDWELSLGSLAIAIAHRPDAFLDKDAGRWTGTTRSSAACSAAPAEARVAAEWDASSSRARRALRVRPPVGHRAETCELVMALDAIGLERTRARAVHVGPVPPSRGRWLLDRHELRQRGLRRARRALPGGAAHLDSAAVVLARERARRQRPDGRPLPRRGSSPWGLTPQELIEAGAEIEAQRTT